MSSNAGRRVGPFWVESWRQLAGGAVVLLVALGAYLAATQAH